MSRTHGLRGVNAPPFDGLADIRKWVILRDEFVGGLLSATGTVGDIGELGWTTSIIAGDGAVTSADSLAFTGTAADFGVIQVGTGVTTPADEDEIAFTIGGDDVVLRATDPLYIAFIAGNQTVTAQKGYFGVFTDADTVSGLGVDSVCLSFDSVEGTTWLANCTNGSTTTTVDTGVVAVAAELVCLEIAVTTGSAEFYIEGEHVASISTNVPTAAKVMQLGAKVATSAAAEKFINIDAFMARVPVSRGGDAVRS